MAPCRPNVAYVLQDASLALGWVRATRTLPRHAEVAKREVVLDWIVRIELPQRIRDLFGRCPACSAAIRQSEVAADAMDVCVDGHYELGGCNRPESEVDAVGGADHPTRVENQTLARASGARIADQVTQAATGPITTKRIGEPGQTFPELSVASPMKMEERLAEGSVFTEQVACPRQDGREMLAPIDAVDETPKAATELCVARIYDGCRRFRTQRDEHAVDASPGGHGVSECQARRDEPHDLLVAMFIVAVDEIDRVSASSRLRVATSEQYVQAFTDTVHFPGVLAILPSQLQ